MADWVGRIDTTRVETKLRERHNLTGRDVDDAVARGAHDRAWWHTHDVYGERLILTGTTYDGRQIIAYLRPIDRQLGDWECLTAYPLD